MSYSFIICISFFSSNSNKISFIALFLHFNLTLVPKRLIKLIFIFYDFLNIFMIPFNKNEVKLSKTEN